MEWLIKQLFGHSALDHVGDKIKAAVLAFVVSNPAASKAVVVTEITAKADALIPAVLKWFPGWAVPILETLLSAELPNLISAAYDAAIKVLGPTGVLK